MLPWLQRGQDPEVATTLMPKFEELSAALQCEVHACFVPRPTRSLPGCPTFTARTLGSVSGAVFKERQWGPGPISRALSQLAHHEAWQQRLEPLVPVFVQVG